MQHAEMSRIINEQKAALAEAILARIFSHQPELKARYQSLEHQKSLRDIKYHLSYLSESIAISRPALFADYIAWAGPVMESYGIRKEILELTLTSIQEILLEEMDPSAHDIIMEHLKAGSDQLMSVVPEISSFLSEEAPLGDLAFRYLDAVLEGNRHTASQMILNAVAEGASVKDIYLHIFQPVQYEIGRLWQTKIISVAQEHYATAVTQLVMSQLYPQIFAMERCGRTLVATCVGEELHEMGVRMVADFFEMAGWDTFYLGANTPTSSIIKTVIDRRADVLAVSATMAMHLGRVRNVISAIRSSEVGNIKVLAGGYPFNRITDLWQRVGADGYAPDAESAIKTAEHLISQGYEL